MKNVFVVLVIFSSAVLAYGQPSNYESRIVSAEWMPDGKSILVTAVKFHKTDQQAPFSSKVFQYFVSSGKILPLFEDASNVNPSSDGSKLLFMKRGDPRGSEVYLFDMQSKSIRQIKTDTLRKFALKWSPDEKKIVYNTSLGEPGVHTPVEIFVHDLETGISRQITHSGGNKSYSPAWSPNSKRIVYYFEKGDGHDQIWLTDVEGSFHTNLTNDTATHNFFPSWIDDQTLIYTSSPSNLMMMRADGSGKKKIPGLQGEGVEYNSAARKFLYLLSENENKLVVFDWPTSTSTVLLEGSQMLTKF